MLIYKILSGIAAVALGAAVMLVVPGVSPEVEAGTPPAAVKGDRLDYRPSGQACSERAWPYYEPDCLRKTEASERPLVRVLSFHRLPAKRAADAHK